MPRPPSCLCGDCPKCKERARKRANYQAMTIEERRELVARRDKEKVRERDRQRAKAPKRQAHVKATVKRWRQANPLRMKAHNAVARALKSGALIKGPCEREGVDCNGPVHAHHDDYEKPLEVRWFCGRHHHEHHAEERAREAARTPTAR